MAHAQAGCLLGDVDRETQLHGLAAVLGFVSNTGCAGLTLGGGFGYLSRRFGWTSDNVASIDLVTADGRAIRASEREHSDLFWGLRGGGGNFGVATSFEYALHPVGPDIIGGAIAWRGEDAGRVLEMYRTLVADAPPELTCVAGLRLAPPAPWLAPDVHGKPIVALFVCYSGSLADGEKLLAPIKAFGAPVGDVVQKRPYVSQQALLDATQPKGRRYYWKSEYLRGFEPGLFTQAIEHAGRIVSPHSAILIFPLGGAISRLPEDHSAVGNRDAVAVLNIGGSWERADDDSKNIDWARGAWRDLRQYSTGGTYVNFLTEDDGDERTRAAYRTNYARLAEVKAAWDPSNLLSHEQEHPADEIAAARDRASTSPEPFSCDGAITMSPHPGRTSRPGSARRLSFDPVLLTPTAPEHGCARRLIRTSRLVALLLHPFPVAARSAASPRRLTTQCTLEARLYSSLLLVPDPADARLGSASGSQRSSRARP